LTGMVARAAWGRGGGGGCGAAAARPATRLTVVTYNIHHAAGMDEKIDVERIARVIRDARPDLVALQEVDAGTKRASGAVQAEQLGRLLNMHHAYGPAMDFGGGKYGNAILSRHEIVSTQVVALPHKPGDQREPRAALAATVSLPDGGGEIVFVSTHLDHTRASPDRLEQARAINEQLGDVRPPAILAGDFNCQPGSPPMAELANVWTLVSDAGGGGGPSPSFPSTRPQISIDHVLVKPRERWRAIEARVIDEPMASDHRPVVVKLELKRGD
jgi:endonuclease/exonuclease/phosphatase family metal-dependent hydrolase